MIETGAEGADGASNARRGVTRDAALRLEAPVGWLAPIAVATYILAATFAWHVPTPDGVPFAVPWGILTVLGLAGAQALVLRLQPRGRTRLRPVEATAVLAVAGMLVTDLTIPFSQGLRDLGIYLQAGRHFVEGAPVYMTAVLTTAPDDQANFPFLYPPFTLPLFAVLAALPYQLAAAIWVAGMTAAAVLGMRLIGMPWRWAVAGLLWPPFVAGLWVGNVAIGAFLLFAVGPWLGATLVLGAAFKVYSGVAGLWLLRERRWRALAAGIGGLLALVLVTLPLTGTQLWLDWVNGLELFERSQPLVPAALYGEGLPRYIPRWAYLSIAAVSVITGLVRRGREGIARLGVASIVAGPSVYSHGYPFAIPAILGLRASWLWVVLGILSVAPGPVWWIALLIVAIGWFVPALRRPQRDRDPLHPLAGARGPWEGASLGD